MSSDTVNSLIAIVVGVLVIALRPQLYQMYLARYNNKWLRWLHGPLPISRSYLDWSYLILGISFILIGVAGLAGFLKWA